MISLSATAGTKNNHALSVFPFLQLKFCTNYFFWYFLMGRPGRSSCFMAVKPIHSTTQLSKRPVCLVRRGPTAGACSIEFRLKTLGLWMSCVKLLKFRAQLQTSFCKNILKPSIFIDMASMKPGPSSHPTLANYGAPTEKGFEHKNMRL